LKPLVAGKSEAKLEPWGSPSSTAVVIVVVYSQLIIVRMRTLFTRLCAGGRHKCIRFELFTGSRQDGFS
jgi:hypothetical protein